MRSTVAQFCKQCSICALTKDSTQHTQGALQPLPVPPAQFHSLNLDFITDLPLAQGFNCVLTVVNHLTKFTHLIPCSMGEDKLLAAQNAKLLFENIVRFFGVPKELVHNCDYRFTAHFWRELWHIFGTNTSASTAFHPPSGGQNECTNHKFK